MARRKTLTFAIIAAVLVAGAAWLLTGLQGWSKWQPVSADVSRPLPTTGQVTIGAASVTPVASGTTLPRTTVATPVPVPVALQLDGTASGRIGVQHVGAVNSQIASLVKATGAELTRYMLYWSKVEPTLSTPPAFKWDSYDAILSAYAQSGLNVIVEVRGNPKWAASTSCGALDKIDLTSPDNAFARFVTAIVSRYRVAPFNVKNWEFYNEPEGENEQLPAEPGVGCWGNHPHPRDYAKMLQVAYGAVKRADPTAKVWLGGLAHENPPPFNMNFLDEVLEAGGGDYFDIANLHYYSSQNPTWSSYGWDIAGKTNAIRAIMARHGVSKPMAVTELGWTTTNASDSKDLALHGERQASYVAKVLARGLATNLYAMIWFSLSDYDGGDLPYGLMSEKMQPRPAYQAFRTALSEFGDARSIRALRSTDVGGIVGVEGYAFDVDGQQRWVLWMHETDVWERESSQATMRKPGNANAVKDKLGQAIAGDVLKLDGSPVFLRFQQLY